MFFLCKVAANIEMVMRLTSAVGRVLKNLILDDVHFVAIGVLVATMKTTTATTATTTMTPTDEVVDNRVL